MRMSPSRRSSVSSTSSDSPENRCFDFIVLKLTTYGSLPLQHLINQLSALPHNVQSAVGTSKLALRAFLEKYPEMFKIDTKGNVSLLKPIDSSCYPRAKRDSSCDSSVSARSHLPEEIKDGTGVIIRIFPAYGFMKIIKPRKSSIYFTAMHFGDRKKTLMADYDLSVGQILGFDAVLGPPNCEAPYRAVRVWFAESEDDCNGQAELTSKKKAQQHNKGQERSHTSPAHVNKGNSSHKAHNTTTEGRVFENSSRVKTPVPKSQNKPVKPNSLNPKVKNAASEDESNDEYITEGIVQNLFDNHGFLTIKCDPTERVFFHANQVIDQKISNLNRVLKKGDTIWFEAIKSSRPSVKAKWEATKVWIDPPAQYNAAESESYDQSPNSGKKVKVDSNGSNNAENGCRGEPLNAKHAVISANVSHLTGEHGKIFFLSSGDPVVKFGPSYSHQAIIDAAAVYINEEIVEDLNWILTDDDNVMFDAIRIGDKPGWKTELVWMGQRPKIAKGASTPMKSAEAVLSDISGKGKAKSVFDSGPKHLDWADSSYPDDEDETETIPTETPVESPNKVSVGAVETGKVKTEDCEVYISDESDLEDPIPDESDLEDPIPHGGYISCQKHPDSESDHEVNVFNRDGKKEIFMENRINSDDEYLDCSEVNNDECSGRATDLEESPKSQKSESQDDKPVPEKEPPGVFIFDGVVGKITKVFRSYVELTCSETEKRMNVFRADFYCDGKLVSDDHSHMSEVLSAGDTVYLNFFIIVDDEGHFWLKPTLVWVGQKPRDVKDMEPEDFINTQNLSVSCKIPTWKSFRQKNKAKNRNTPPVRSSNYSESMGLLNDLSSPPSAVIHSEEAATISAEQLSCSPVDMIAPSTAICLHQKIKGASDSFLARIDQLQQQAQQKKLQKGLQSLQLDIQSWRDELLLILSENEPESDSQAQFEEVGKYSAEPQPRRKQSTASQTIITGRVVSCDVFPI